MKKMIIVCSVAFFLAACGLVACGGGENSDKGSGEEVEPATTEAGVPGVDYDTARGTGKFHDVEVGDHLDKAMADAGEKVYDLKCSSCHKLSDERLVGPGWDGVTSRHEPAWIMNFMTNTEAMIDVDPKAQAMLEICMVRMPNQNLSDQDARDILEFMRENDGVK